MDVEGQGSSKGQEGSMEINIVDLNMDNLIQLASNLNVQDLASMAMT